MATTLESSLVAAPLQRLVGDEPWRGTATELLEQLANLVPELTARRREWPKTARAVAGEVRRIAPALRAAGIDHADSREAQTGSRLHTFTRMRPESCVTSVTSVTDPTKPVDSGDDSVTEMRHSEKSSVTMVPDGDGVCDAGDDSDATAVDLQLQRSVQALPATRVSDDGVVKSWE